MNIKINIIPVFLVCLACTLAGCGQKGPLFLPEPERAPKPDSASSTKETNTEASRQDKTLEESENQNAKKEKTSDKN